MLNEVSALPARVLLEIAASAGVDSGPLTAGLGFDASTLRRMRRVGWDTYCELIERLERECGGPEAFEALVLASYHLSLPEELQWIGHAFVSPMALARGIFEVIDPALFPTVDFRVEAQAADRLLVSGRLKEGARACPAFFRACVASLRSMTAHLGLPPAEIEVRELTPRALVVHVTLPDETPARRDEPELARFSQELVRYFATEVRVLDATVQAQAGIIADIGALGRELARHLELEPLAEALLTMLAKLGFAHAALHVSLPNGDAKSWQRAHEAATLVHCLPLALGENQLGRLEVAGGGDVHTLEQLLPWITLVVDNARGARANEGHGVDARMAGAERRLRLTARQAEVLALMVQGRANKEIAAALECAENTVEFHVTQLLKKSGANTRTQLVARFWAGALAAAPP